MHIINQPTSSPIHMAKAERTVQAIERLRQQYGKKNWFVSAVLISGSDGKYATTPASYTDATPATEIWAFLLSCKYPPKRPITSFEGYEVKTFIIDKK